MADIVSQTVVMGGGIRVERGVQPQVTINSSYAQNPGLLSQELRNDPDIGILAATLRNGAAVKEVTGVWSAAVETPAKRGPIALSNLAAITHGLVASEYGRAEYSAREPIGQQESEKTILSQLLHRQSGYLKGWIDRYPEQHSQPLESPVRQSFRFENHTVDANLGEYGGGTVTIKSPTARTMNLTQALERELSRNDELLERVGFVLKNGGKLSICTERPAESLLTLPLLSQLNLVFSRKADQLMSDYYQTRKPADLTKAVRFAEVAHQLNERVIGWVK